MNNYRIRKGGESPMEGKLADSSAWSSTFLLANVLFSQTCSLWGGKHVCKRGEMKLKWYTSPSAGQSRAAESRLLLTNSLSQLCALTKRSFLFARRCFNLDAEDLCLQLLSP